MTSNQIIDHEGKNNILSNMFDEINSVYVKLNIISELGNKYGIELPMPSYTNFRDSMFHYAHINEATDEYTIIGNMYALREHLERSVKDALITFLRDLTDWLQFFCIENKRNSIIENKINDKFHDFRVSSSWNLILFKDVRDYLVENTNYDIDDINYYCMSYCSYLIQSEHVDYVIKIRSIFHQLKNHMHSVRSASASLLKTYDDNEQFENLVKELNDMHRYLYSINIHYSLYFAVGVK